MTFFQLADHTESHLKQLELVVFLEHDFLGTYDGLRWLAIGRGAQRDFGA
jgi:hypothetical protein